MALTTPNRRPVGVVRYYVDDEGRVWRLLASGAFRQVATWARGTRTLYPAVTLWQNNRKRTVYVHRLVAEAFPEVCGTDFDGAVVRHLDGDPTNTRASNLRFGTRDENEADKMWHAEHGRGTVREEPGAYVPDADLGF